MVRTVVLTRLFWLYLKKIGFWYLTNGYKIHLISMYVSLFDKKMNKNHTFFLVSQINEKTATHTHMLYIDFRPGQTCHSKDGGSCIFHWRGRAWLTIWDRVKIPRYSHKLMHRKRGTCELHDSYFRSMTIKHAIPKTAEVHIPMAIKWEVYFSKNCVARLYCVVVMILHASAYEFTTHTHTHTHTYIYIYIRR